MSSSRKLLSLAVPSRLRSPSKLSLFLSGFDLHCFPFSVFCVAVAVAVVVPCWDFPPRFHRLPALACCLLYPLEPSHVNSNCFKFLAS